VTVSTARDRNPERRCPHSAPPSQKSKSYAFLVWVLLCVLIAAAPLEASSDSATPVAFTTFVTAAMDAVVGITFRLDGGEAAAGCAYWLLYGTESDSAFFLGTELRLGANAQALGEMGHLDEDGGATIQIPWPGYADVYYFQAVIARNDQALYQGDAWVTDVLAIRSDGEVWAEWEAAQGTSMASEEGPIEGGTGDDIIPAPWPPRKPVVLAFLATNEEEEMAGRAITSALSEQLGVDIVWKPAGSVDALIDTFTSADQYAFGFLSADVYLTAHERTDGDIVPRLVEVKYGRSYNYSSVYAYRDRGIESWDDLAGLTWCYPYEESSVGYWLANSMFERLGLRFAATVVTGGHTNSIVALIEGQCDFCTAYGFPPSPPRAISATWQWGDEPEKWLWDPSSWSLVADKERGTCSDLRRAVRNTYGEEWVLENIAVVANIGLIPNWTLTFGPGFPREGADRIVEGIEAQMGTEEGRMLWESLDVYELAPTSDNAFDCCREILDKTRTSTISSACAYFGEPAPPSDVQEEVEVAAEQHSDESIVMVMQPAYNYEDERAAGEAIADMLSTSLGIPMTLITAESSDVLLDALLAPDRLAFGFLSPDEYLDAHERTGGDIAPRLVNVRYRLPYYYSSVYAYRDRAIDSWDDLEGLTWCYNDTGSKSGYQIPLEMFEGLGLQFRDAFPTGGNTNSMVALIEGQCDFCTSYGSPPMAPSGSSATWQWGDEPEKWLWDSSSWRLVPDEERGVCSDLRHAVRKMYDEQWVVENIAVVANLGPIPNEALTFGSGFPPELANRIIEAIQSTMSTEEGASLWRTLEIIELVPISDADFDCYREIMNVARSGTISSTCAYFGDSALPTGVPEGADVAVGQCSLLRMAWLGAEDESIETVERWLHLPLVIFLSNTCSEAVEVTFVGITDQNGQLVEIIWQSADKPIIIGVGDETRWYWKTPSLLDPGQYELIAETSAGLVSLALEVNAASPTAPSADPS